MKITKISYLEFTPGIVVDGELSKHKLTVSTQIRFKRDQKGAHHFDILTGERKTGEPQRWRRLKIDELNLLIELSPPPLGLWVGEMRERARTAAQVD